MRVNTVIRFAVLCVLGFAVACDSPQQRREKTIQRTTQALAVGDGVTAEAEIEAYLGFAPNDVEARVRLAEVLASRGQRRRALELITDLPQRTTLDVRGRSLLGRLLVHDDQLRRGAPILAALEREGSLKPDLKVSFFEAAARCDPSPFLPSLPVSWIRDLVDRYLRLGNIERSVECLAKVPEDDPQRAELVDRVLAAALEKNDLQTVTRSGLVDAADTPRKLLIRHRVLLGHDQWELAAEVEQRFMARFPTHPLRYEILLAMASRAIRSGRLQDALGIANQAAELHPSSTQALALKARALRGLGRESEALLAFQMILDLDPHNAVASREVRTATEEGERTIDLHLVASEVGRP